MFVIIAGLPNRTILRRTATRRPQRYGARSSAARSEDSPVDSVVKELEVGSHKRARPQTSAEQPQLTARLAAIRDSEERTKKELAETQKQLAELAVTQKQILEMLKTLKKE